MAWTYALIENVVTRADVRGQRTALMRAAVTRAQAQGVYKVMLITGLTAPEVHRRYRGAGFQADATAYRLRSGSPSLERQKTAP